MFAGNEISDNITIIYYFKKYTKEGIYIYDILVIVVHMINNLWMPEIA